MFQANPRDDIQEEEVLFTEKSRKNFRGWSSFPYFFD